MQFIDLKTPYQQHKAAINARIQRVLDHGQFILGEEIFELEEQLAQFIGVRHCITVSSGTDALLLALMALGIKPGDEVITTPFSFFATAEVIMLLGAKPVFVDINPQTFNIDPSLIEAAITTKTTCIMPVSLYGQCADLAMINQIAAKYNLPVIEDAAQSFGAECNDKKSCSLTTIATTSFFPTKVLGCYGDGGACFTNDDGLADKIRSLLDHGQTARYHHQNLGINGRFDTIQAAVLLEKLQYLPADIELRQRVANAYNEILADVVSIPFIAAGQKSVYAQYTILIESRDQVQAALKKRGIPTAVHYPKIIPEQPACSEYQNNLNELHKAKNAAKLVLSLPMHPLLTPQDIQQVAAALKLP